MQFFKMISQDPSQLKQSCLAIMGGGGKTTLLYRLGRELSNHYKRVLLTSLTKSAASPEHETVFLNKIHNLDIDSYFGNHNPLFVMHSIINQYKISGISENELYQLQTQSDLCFFECDGARKQSLKVHTDYDPSVPAFATQVVIVVGADVVQTTLKEGKVHRKDLFKSLWKVTDDFVLNTEFIATVVTSRRGYLGKIPPGLKRIYFVNKADIHRNKAERLAQSIAKQSGCPTYYGSLKDEWYRKVI